MSKRTPRAQQGARNGSCLSGAVRAVEALRFEHVDPHAEQLSARGTGYAVSVSPGGARLTLLVQPAGAQPEPVTLGVSLVGARVSAPHADQQLPGVSNYFLGSSPADWRAGVSGFARVTQSEVLPGVDIVYYGTRAGELEYDLRLAPGVDPHTLELSLDGAQSLQLSENGDLIVGLGHDASLIKRAPVAYQLVDGAKVPVALHYELHGQHVGFSAASFDASRPLVIDPVLSYATFLGAQNYDELFATTADSNSNTYVVGYTTGVLFPTVVPVQGTYAGGASDAVVCKLNANGNAYVYCTYFGGNNADQAYAVATDPAGNAYVTGVTYSTNFPTLNAVQGSPGGGGLADTFITKLNPAGQVTLYSTYLGGNQDDFPRGIAVNGSGSPIVTGVTFSPNFPLQGALDASLGGNSDAFVTSLTPAGTALGFSTFLGGAGDEYGNAIALNSTGEIYVVGSTSSSGFPTVNAYQPTFNGGARDAFVSRLSASGSSLAYSSFLGGGFTDEALGLAVLGDVPVVVGSTTSTNFPLLKASQTTLASPGFIDGFVTRFNAGAGSLSFSTYLGGNADDALVGVAVDLRSNIYVVGHTTSNNVPIVNGSPGQLQYHGAGDVLLGAYDAAGVRAYTGYIGGLQLDQPGGIAVSSNGLVHVVGSTQSPDFPNINAPQATFAGSQDGFILRYPLIPSSGAGVPAASHLHALALAGALLGLFLLSRAQRAIADRV